jgi:hypothetical protein
MSTLELFLSPEKVVATLSETSSRTTGTCKRSLIMRSSVFLCEMKSLELWVSESRRYFVELELVYRKGKGK